MTEPLRVAVLASGSGSNLQALLDRFHGAGARKEAEEEAVPHPSTPPQPSAPARSAPPVQIVRVIGSRSGIGALDRADTAGVPSSVLPRDAAASEKALIAELREARAGLVVLAGFVRQVPSSVVAPFHGRMLNIHPALLPAFGGLGMYGRRVHEAVLDSGARVTGATVHFVGEEYDRGPIAAQWPVPVLEGDDADGLAARVLAVEHKLLPAVVEAFARGDVELADDGRCVWRRPWFPDERFRMGRKGHGSSEGDGKIVQ